ncbi:hypothetical protein IC615_24910 [Serratia ureilytica]
MNRLLPLNYVSQDDVDSAKAELDSFEAQRRQYQAELQQVGWQIKASEIDLLRTIIRAPFDGQVVSLDASRGNGLAHFRRRRFHPHGDRHHCRFG